MEEVIRREGGWSMYGESLEPGGLRKENVERILVQWHIAMDG